MWQRTGAMGASAAAAILGRVTDMVPDALRNVVLIAGEEACNPSTPPESQLSQRPDSVFYLPRTRLIDLALFLYRVDQWPISFL